MSSLWTVQQDIHKHSVEWFQSIQSTQDTAWTLVPVTSPPIDLFFLEQYTKQPFAKIRNTQQSIVLHRPKINNNNVCFDFKTREYCSSESSLSGSYMHAPTGQSIRVTNVPQSVLPFTLPSYFQDSPATSLLLLLQTILAVAYWNARLSPTTVGLLVDNDNVEEPWRLLTGATAHFDVWHLGMNMMTLSSLGTALEKKRIGSIAFLATNMSMIVYTGILWWAFQLLRARRFPPTTNQHPIPTVGYSGVLFAWLVVLSMEQGTVCPIFFLPQLCLSSVPVWGGFSIHPGPLIQLVLMQLLLPRASWTGHLAGIVVGFIYQWRILPVSLCWWPSISVPVVHFLWCLRQNRQRFLSQRPGLSSRGLLYMGIAHGFLWVASILTLGGFVSILTLEYLIVVLWWHSTRSDDTTMARGYVLLAVLVLVSDAMTAGAWMVVLRPAWTSMIASVMTLFFRTVALLVSLVWTVHSHRHRLYQEEQPGIFYYVFHWTVLKPAQGILVATSFIRKTSLEESSLSSWDHLGAGRRLGGTHAQEMVQLIWNGIYSVCLPPVGKEVPLRGIVAYT